jgi:hypothetical protein
VDVLFNNWAPSIQDRVGLEMPPVIENKGQFWAVSVASILAQIMSLDFTLVQCSSRDSTIPSYSSRGNIFPVRAPVSCTWKFNMLKGQERFKVVFCAPLHFVYYRYALIFISSKSRLHRCAPRSISLICRNI